MNHPVSIDKSLPGSDNIYRKQLDNGIIILASQKMHSPSVIVSGYINTGSQYDPIEKMGLASFTAACLVRGTQFHNFQELFEILENNGASLAYHGNVHTTAFNGRALVEDLGLLLNLTAEGIRYPTFPQNEVEKVRTQILTALMIRAQDTAAQASMRFDELIFGTHPYGHPEGGKLQTIPGITQEDLIAFHRQTYNPQDMVITVVGAIPVEKAVEEVERYFGDWQASPLPQKLTFPPFPTFSGQVRDHIAIAGKMQTDLVMGCFGPRRTAADYLAITVGNSVLGQFGMMGRIGEAVRERAGLAYHASSSLQASLLAGTWEIDAGVAPQNLDRAIGLICDEIERFISSPVDQQELDDSRSLIIGQLPLAFETNSETASGLIAMERYQLGLDYFRTMPALLQEITPRVILQASQNYLDPGKLVIVSSGS